ncbi:MAG: DEAD/DEAH box helicase [Planctomycetes bacterium]|nr:DEAD/DEAH box helicase [Planctomycetota bacterium]
MPETMPQPALSFSDLKLPAPLLKALEEVGYESPSPIQAETIPPLLAGKDVLGQAQTGTGKTAAFALPILARIDVKKMAPQALVLAPTRELAIQVAEAFQKYAVHLKDFHVLPIYGGQHFGPQLHALRRGVHVIVGTPGRVIDHMDRGTLKLDDLACLVLDEADEMLRMGFIDDVEKVLKNTPSTRQVALFSATMPPRIRRIAQTYLKSPAEITIKSKTSTVTNTRQRFWMAGGAVNKLDALTRILEAEPFDAMLVFVRTRQETHDLAGRLEARGFGAAPLSGDIEQRMRERTVNRLKSGELDIIVATDVAARGLDVERISHVVNFDVPTDTESYVHRIGRTGRAGRSGEAILFVMPRERHMLRAIEKATRQQIAPMELPSIADVNAQRLSKLRDRVGEILSNKDLAGGLAPFRTMVEAAEKEHNSNLLDVAAALAYMAQDETPLMSEATRAESRSESRDEFKPAPRAEPRFPSFPSFQRRGPEAGMQSYRIEVGHQHGVKPANIVGAIANEADLGGKLIGRIEIFDDHTLVDLPEGMPPATFQKLQTVRVAGQMLRISPADAARPTTSRKLPPRVFDPKKKPFKKPFTKRPRA